MEKRDIGVSILFTILTFGIYGIVWFIKLTDEVSELSGDDSLSGGTSFIFAILTLGLYLLYWNYKIGKMMCGVQVKYGKQVNDYSLLYLIFGLANVSIATYIMVQSELNSVLDKSN